jgi:uncharacterized protein
MHPQGGDKMPRVVHFAVPANDPETLAGFYGKIFGWQTQKAPGPMKYWLTGEGEPGIDGGFLRRQHPQQPVCNTIDVSSVDQAMTTVLENCGKTALPKMAIPGYGWLTSWIPKEIFLE